MPWRMWTAMALSIDTIRRQRQEEDQRARRVGGTRMARARKRR